VAGLEFLIYERIPVNPGHTLACGKSRRHETSLIAPGRLNQAPKTYA